MFKSISILENTLYQYIEDQEQHRALPWPGLQTCSLKARRSNDGLCSNYLGGSVATYTSTIKDCLVQKLFEQDIRIFRSNPLEKFNVCGIDIRKPASSLSLRALKVLHVFGPDLIHITNTSVLLRIINQSYPSSINSVPRTKKNTTKDISDVQRPDKEHFFFFWQKPPRKGEGDCSERRRRLGVLVLVRIIIILVLGKLLRNSLEKNHEYYSSIKSSIV